MIYDAQTGKLHITAIATLKRCRRVTETWKMNQRKTENQTTIPVAHIFIFLGYYSDNDTALLRDTSLSAFEVWSYVSDAVSAVSWHYSEW